MTITEPAPAVLARYSFRKSILEPEKTYVLYPDRLVIEADGTPVAAYALEQVTEVHLKYERTKQRGYFQCFIHTRAGTVALRHVHWGGVANFEDRGHTYTPFVRALLRALANRPGVTFRMGSLLNFVAAIVGLPLLAIMGVLALVAGLLIPAALAGLLVFMCISVLPRSRPGSFDPANPPASLLPG